MGKDLQKHHSLPVLLLTVSEAASSSSCWKCRKRSHALKSLVRVQHGGSAWAKDLTFTSHQYISTSMSRSSSQTEGKDKLRSCLSLDFPVKVTSHYVTTFTLRVGVRPFFFSPNRNLNPKDRKRDQSTHLLPLPSFMPRPVAGSASASWDGSSAPKQPPSDNRAGNQHRAAPCRYSPTFLTVRGISENRRSEGSPA